MKNTKWMVLCLFLGFLMAAGMMSTVPIYMDASLQRMLVKEMESYQLQTGSYPGTYTVSRELPAGVDVESQVKLASTLPEYVAGEVADVGIPVSTEKTILKDNLLYLIRGATNGASSSTRVQMMGMSGLENHVTITKGRMYCESGIDENGNYEVIVTESGIKSLGIVYGETYKVTPIDTTKTPIYVSVVGVFEQSDVNDAYWSEGFDSYVNGVFAPSECITGSMIPGGTVQLSGISVRYCLDYHSVDMNAISSITSAIDDDFATYTKLGYTFEMGISNILKSYVERAASLTGILWAIQIPTMVMLAFYLFMVSRLNVEQERNEIAVLKSRGASPGQIFRLYAMEAGVLGGVTLVVAPFIGLLLCSFLGVSNGFLEFVNRTGINAKITFTAVIYALIAVVVFFCTTMIPIIPASKLTIVQYKQSKNRVGKAAMWELCGIDFILILLSAGFYILYSWNLNAQMESGAFVASGQIDPLLFIFATCLILGLGLLFVRLYPYVLKLIYRIGKPFWTPAQYMAITTVSCQGGNRERFLMLFLVITFGFGIFSANTARAINNNKEDRIYYQNGADIVITEYWIENSYTVDGVTTTAYAEKDFARFESLTGVETATKVLINTGAKATIGKKTDENVNLMAIEPDKFAQTAWFRDDLLPVQWYNYCNALTNYPAGVLISSSMADEYGAELGDEIKLKWSSNDYVSATVLAIVDYWPGMNPNETTGRGETKEFAVMNYNYVYNATQLEPYEVWIKLADGATSEALYADISAKKIPLETITDSSQRLIAEKTEPALQGMNGGLTLGFIIIMIMAIIGFLIYWILSIRSRTLQFGILRAMGMTLREIIGMLGYEQLLVSGASIAIAFVIGGVTSDIFVPLFQAMYDVVDQIPPFIVSATMSDYLKIYILIVVMLGGGFAILGRLIKKININKALKLGED